MSEPVVLTRLDEGVLWVTMNRPENLNACNDGLLSALQDAFKTARKDTAVRVVVLTGAGRGFCSGQDLKDVSGRGLGFREHLLATYNPIIQAMRSLEKPVITAVNGVAAGAGASLALAGDIRIWSDSASLVQAFSRVGLVPDSGSTWMLQRMVGWNRAFQMMVTAEKIGPDEALRLGLCERVLPAAEFEAGVRALAAQLASGPTRAFGLAKRALNHAATSTLAEALDYEAHLQEMAGETADHREGVRAFAEKRPPDFRGE